MQIGRHTVAIMDRNGGGNIERMVDGVCGLVAEVGVDGGELVESGVQRGVGNRWHEHGLWGSRSQLQSTKLERQ